MPLVQSADQGGEYLLAWARQKLVGYHAEMLHTRSYVLNKTIYASDGAVVYISSVYLNNGQFRDSIRVTAGVFDAFLTSVGDPCACDGIYVDAVNFVVDSAATVDGVTTVTARLREVQRYNNVVVWAGAWATATYVRSMTTDDPPKLSEVFTNWYDQSRNKVRSGTAIAEDYASTTLSLITEVLGEYPGPDPTTDTDTPQTCALIEPVPDAGVFVRAGLGTKQVGGGLNPTFSQTEATLFKFEPSYLSNAYSPVTGYAHVPNPTAGTETFSDVPVPPGTSGSGTPQSGAIWTTPQEAAYMWSLGYSALRSLSSVGSPEHDRFLVDQAAYDAEYPLWLAREEARIAACVLAVATAIETGTSDDNAASYAVKALRSPDDIFMSDAPPAMGAHVDTYAIEYDYMLDGSSVTGVLIQPSGAPYKARVKSGTRSSLYRDVSHGPAPVTKVLTKYLDKEIAVTTAPVNEVVLLRDAGGAYAQAGSTQKQELIARLKATVPPNDITQLSDSDKVLSLFYDDLPAAV